MQKECVGIWHHEYIDSEGNKIELGSRTRYISDPFKDLCNYCLKYFIDLYGDYSRSLVANLHPEIYHMLKDQDNQITKDKKESWILFERFNYQFDYTPSMIGDFTAGYVHIDFPDEPYIDSDTITSDIIPSDEMAVIRPLLDDYIYLLKPKHRKIINLRIAKPELTLEQIKEESGYKTVTTIKNVLRDFRNYAKEMMGEREEDITKWKQRIIEDINRDLGNIWLDD